jgi:hypothetical protein
MKTDRQLLEDILITEVAVLSKLFDMEARSKGSTRSPADYTREAMELVERLRAPVIEKLSSLR